MPLWRFFPKLTQYRKFVFVAWPGRCGSETLAISARHDGNHPKYMGSHLGVSGDGDLGFGGLLGYPTSFLISRDGRIVKKVQGLISYDELTKAIEGQL